MIKSKIALIVIISILCAATRVLPVFLVPETIKEVTSDSLEYNELAVNILTGKGYMYASDKIPFKGVTAYRTPGYPLFLAAVYSLFGIENYTAVRMVQAILDSLIPLLLYLIAGMFFDRKVAITALILGIFYKPFIVMNFYGGPAFLLSENLVIVVFLVFIYLVLLAMKKSSLLIMSAAGILLGVSSLIRSAIVLFLALTIIIIALGFRNMRKTLLFTGVLLISFVIIISPWILRNYIVFKKPVFSTQAGVVLYAGNNPSAKGGWGRSIPAEVENRLKGMDEFKVNEFLTREALRYIAKNIRIYPKLILKKLIVAFQPFYAGYEYNFSYAIMFPLFLLSFFVIRRDNPFYAVMSATIVYFIITSMIFFGDPRFRYPLETIFLIGSAAFISNVFNQKGGKIFSAALVFYAALNIFIYFNWGTILPLIRGA